MDPSSLEMYLLSFLLGGGTLGGGLKLKNLMSNKKGRKKQGKVGGVPKKDFQSLVKTVDIIKLDIQHLKDFEQVFEDRCRKYEREISERDRMVENRLGQNNDSIEKKMDKIEDQISNVDKHVRVIQQAIAKLEALVIRNGNLPQGGLPSTASDF